MRRWTVLTENVRNGQKLPSHFKQGFTGQRDPVPGPGQEVELGHCPRFVALRIFEIETSHEVVFTPDMFGHKMYLQVSKFKGSTSF